MISFLCRLQFSGCGLIEIIFQFWISTRSTSIFLSPIRQLNSFGLHIDLSHLGSIFKGLRNTQFIRARYYILRSYSLKNTIATRNTQVRYRTLFERMPTSFLMRRLKVYKFRSMKCMYEENLKDKICSMVVSPYSPSQGALNFVSNAKNTDYLPRDNINMSHNSFYFLPLLSLMNKRIPSS